MGLSAERLARIGTAVQRSIDEKRIAGAVTLVARRGHVAWLKAQGMLDREAGKPMEADTLFRICSMSKPIISLAAIFYPPEDKMRRRAAAYTWYPEKGLRRFRDAPISEGTFTYSADYPYRGPMKLFAGGAGLCSTAMDYARFCQMMLDGGRAGGARLISRKTVESMTSDCLGKIAPDHGFGLGFGVDGVKAPLEELGSSGEYNWANSSIRSLWWTRRSR